MRCTSIVFGLAMGIGAATTAMAADRLAKSDSLPLQKSEQRPIYDLESGRAAGPMANGIVTTKHGSLASVAFASVALTVGGFGPSPIGPSAVTTH
jgi:hypothetical protein